MLKIYLRAWTQAFRPKTLTAAVVPIFVATALVSAVGIPIKWHLSVFALLSSLLIQIGTNLFNDAIDFKKGADTEDRLGPKRITQSGQFSSQQVMFAGVMSLLAATAMGVPLILEGGWPILIVGVFSLFLAYSYTGGPFPLAYLGLGDLFVMLFFGVIAIVGLFYIQTKEISLWALLGGVQIGSLATVLIVINNLRDREGDKKVGKKTLAVRFGEKFSKHEMTILSIFPFFLGLVWWQGGFLWAAGLPVLVLPLSWFLLRNIYRHSPSEIYNQFLMQAAGVHLVFGLLLSLGLVL